MHVVPQGWKEVARGLVDYNLCKVIPASEVFSWSGELLLNGAFAVGKREYLAGLEESQDTELQRLIMNLIPFNTICTDQLRGDVDSPPYMSQCFPRPQPAVELRRFEEHVLCV